LQNQCFSRIAQEFQDAGFQWYLFWHRLYRATPFEIVRGTSLCPSAQVEPPTKLTPRNRAVASLKRMFSGTLSRGYITRNVGAWHYVNVPIKESRYDPKYCQAGAASLVSISS